MASPTIALSSIRFRNHSGQIKNSLLEVGKVVTLGTDKPQIASLMVHAWEVKPNEYRTNILNVVITFDGGVPGPVSFWVPADEIEWMVGL